MTAIAELSKWNVTRHSLYSNGQINSLEKTKRYSSTEQERNLFEERHCLQEITRNPEINTR